MITLSLIFLVVALVLFAVATFLVVPRWNLVAAGLFFATLAVLLERVHVAA